MGVPGWRGHDGTTLHPRERLLVESRKEPAMIPLYFLPPEAAFLPPEVAALRAELPPPPLWWTLGLAGVATLLTALAWTLT
jgi:hypothetical protein